MAVGVLHQPLDADKTKYAIVIQVGVRRLCKASLRKIALDKIRPGVSYYFQILALLK